MTIEAAVDRLAAAIERLADLGEMAANARTQTVGTQTVVTPAKEKPAVDKPVAEKTKEKSKEKSKSKSKETPPADASDDENDDAPKATLEQVRTALNALQAAKGSPHVKTLLISFDAPALSKLAPEKYQAVIDKATADAESEEE